LKLEPLQIFDNNINDGSNLELLLKKLINSDSKREPLSIFLSTINIPLHPLYSSPKTSIFPTIYLPSPLCSGRYYLAPIRDVRLDASIVLFAHLVIFCIY
jgi:hypothetical protein